MCIRGGSRGGGGRRRPDPPSNFPKVPFSQEDFNDDPSSVNISEVFVDYVHLERTTGKAIADAIVKCLHDMGFDIENLRGQGYDGASAMSSSIQGVNGKDQELSSFHKITLLFKGGGVTYMRVKAVFVWFEKLMYTKYEIRNSLF